MNVTKNPIAQQHPMHQAGVPLFISDPTLTAVPLVDDVAWTDDYIHIVVAHTIPTDPLDYNFWNYFSIDYPVSMALAEFTRCTYRMGGDIYDRGGNLFTAYDAYRSTSGTWESGTDEFYKELTTPRLQSIYSAGNWRLPSVLIPLNRLVGYHKNDVSFRMKCCWCARAADSYEYFDPESSSISNFDTNFTVYAWRDSDDANAFTDASIMPSGAQTKTGVFNFEDFVSGNVLTESDQIVNMHWDNSSDTIILS